MTVAYTVFMFIFSINLFVYFLAGVRDVIPGEDRRPGLRTALSLGVVMFFWGWIAYSLQRLMALMFDGSALFIVFLAGSYLVLRAMLLLIIEKNESGFLDRYRHYFDLLITHPVVLIPVLLVGYNHFTPIEVLVLLISAWLGYVLALGLFRLIQDRIELENAPHRLKGSGVMLLSLALMAMILTAVQQGFFPRLIP